MVRAERNAVRRSVNSRATWWALAALAAALGACSGDGRQAAPASRGAGATAAPAPAAVTGRELEAYRRELKPLLDRSGQGLRVEALPGAKGGTMVRLTEGFHHVALARQDGPGQQATECVDTQEAAESFLTARSARAAAEDR